MARLSRRLAIMLAVLLAMAAEPARANWPAALSAQPLVQAPLRCAPGIVPINRRCRVVEFAKLGDFTDRAWYYAFYATHWADRHGRLDRGFPVVFYLEQPATLRLSLWVDDAPGLAGRWAMTAPARPVLIERPPAIFLGFTLKAVRGPDDQRLFRLLGQHWKVIDILHRAPAEQARLDAITPPGCAQAKTWRYDWQAFVLQAPLRTDLGGADCGTIVANLDVRNDKLVLTGARLVR